MHHHRQPAPRRRRSGRMRIRAWTRPMPWLAAGFKMSRALGPCITCRPPWFLVSTNRCPCRSTCSLRRARRRDMPCSGGSPYSLWARTTLPGTVSVDVGQRPEQYLNSDRPGDRRADASWAWVSGSRARRYLHSDYADEKREAWRPLGERLDVILSGGNVVPLQRPEKGDPLIETSTRFVG